MQKIGKIRSIGRLEAKSQPNARNVHKKSNKSMSTLFADLLQTQHRVAADQVLEPINRGQFSILPFIEQRLSNILSKI
jgi:hypothetical protein